MYTASIPDGEDKCWINKVYEGWWMVYHNIDKKFDMIVVCISINHSFQL